MKFFRLMVTVVYYMFKPRQLPYSALPQLFLMTIFAALVLKLAFWQPHYFAVAFPNFTPLPRIELINERLTEYVWQSHDEKTLLHLTALFNPPNTNVLGLTSLTSFDSISVNTLQQEQIKTLDLLALYPTSRDLWLYSGWLAYYLNNTTQLNTAVDHLLMIDPNDETVQEFLMAVNQKNH